MSQLENFKEQMLSGYSFKGDSILIGAGMLEGEVIADTKIYAPLKMFNRHGLIAGATGTGKTISLQSITEGLSKAGVPCLIMDVKGDLSGIAAKGSTNPKVEQRNNLLNISNDYKGNPIEMLSISDEIGIPMRATVSEFGPVLFSKVLGLNDTQEGVLSMIFKYCDDKKLPLLDLKDIKQVLISSTEHLKDELTKLYGTFSPSTIGIIQRKIIELEQQGAEKFFGEKSFEVEDLIRIKDGQGMISCFRLADIQDKPKLFSTFMLCLLAEIYSLFPEAGDLDKPKLVFFIDEAHLIFEEASDALKKQLEATIKLIRSKGVGIFFITQNPQDIPEAILGQLGMKVQHALRAFTAKDQQTIKKASENFPISDFYKIDKTLTSMGIGEALFTCLNEKGIPSPLVHTYMKPPLSRIGVLSNEELQDIIDNSDLLSKYSEVVDRQSAYELLNKKIEESHVDVQEKTKDSSNKEEENGGGFFGTIGDAINSPVGKIVTREVTRGLLGVLGLGSTRRKKTGWF